MIDSNSSSGDLGLRNNVVLLHPQDADISTRRRSGIGGTDSLYWRCCVQHWFRSLDCVLQWKQGLEREALRNLELQWSSVNRSGGSMGWMGGVRDWIEARLLLHSFGFLAVPRLIFWRMHVPSTYMFWVMGYVWFRSLDCVLVLSDLPRLEMEAGS